MGALFSRRKKPPAAPSKAAPPSQHESSHRNLSSSTNSRCRHSCESSSSSPAPATVAAQFARSGSSSPDRQPKKPRNSGSPPLLDTANFSVRIEPIRRQGNQISKTHYFLIEEPRYRRCNSSKERCNPIEMYANSSRLFNQFREEPLLPFEMNEHIVATATAAAAAPRDPHSGLLPIRRGRSDTTDYLYNQKRALIARMQLEIPQATYVESHGVLMGTNWNFEEAERRLKMELVHRKIGANYKQCEALLTQHDWDLDCVLVWIHQNWS